jgi:Ca2+-binding RTX toxin-like protein
MSERLWLTRAAVVLTAIFAAAGYTASPALAGTGQSNGTTITDTASPGEQNQVVISRPGGSGTPWIIDDSGVIGSIVAASGCSVATSTELSCPDPGNTVSRFQALTGNMDDRVAIDGSVTSLSSGVLVDGGDGINTIDYSNQFSGVTVDLGAGQATEPNGNVDTLANIQNIDGSSLSDTLVGDANPNVINGQGGSDTIAGGGGGDTLSGGAGTDTVSYGAVGGPEHIDLAAGTATGDGTDTLSSFEAALGSPFADTMTPSNSGSELDGGFGNDTFVSGPGDDTIDGGSGNDTIDYSAASGPINADLGGGSASGDGSDTIVPNSVENLTGSPFADTLAGDANNNVLSGGGGNDVLAGRGGNDTLDGGGGTNTASYRR